MRPWIVGMSGASGALYGIRLVRALTDLGQEVVLVISGPARLVIREEIGIDPFCLRSAESTAKAFLLEHPHLLTIYPPDELTAPIASGSYPVRGMVVIPCSMATLGALASGFGRNLIHRAADCVLKEGRPLIVVPRETPLHTIHLENMLTLSRAGARIVPAMPAFYASVRSAEEMADFIAGKVLDQLNIVHGLYPRWTGPVPRES